MGQNCKASTMERTNDSALRIRLRQQDILRPGLYHDRCLVCFIMQDQHRGILYKRLQPTELG